MPDLRSALFSPLGIEGATVYAIVDGASCEQLLGRLGETKLEFCCLFAGELEEDVAEVAPYLVKLEPDDPFTKWLLKGVEEHPWGIFALVDEEFLEVRKHFRKFLMVKDPAGNNMYFRYYDPRVISIYLPTANSEELKTVFGPVQRFVCQVPGEGLQLYENADGKLLIKGGQSEIQADARHS